MTHLGMAETVHGDVIFFPTAAVQTIQNIFLNIT